MIVVLIETEVGGLAAEVSLETITFARELSAQGGGVWFNLTDEVLGS